MSRSRAVLIDSDGLAAPCAHEFENWDCRSDTSGLVGELSRRSVT